jgi:hypothetical protein
MREGLRSRTKVNDDQYTKNPNGALATGIETAFEIEKTDYTLWRLKVEHGRQTWHYLTPTEAETWPQRVPEKYHLGMETVSPLTWEIVFTVGSAETGCAKDDSRGGEEWLVVLFCAADG